MVDWISIDLKGWLRVAIHSHILCLWCTDDKAKVSCCFCCFVSWACAREIEDSSKAMSSAKSRSLNDLAGCRLERRGWVTTPESSWDEAFFSRLSTSTTNRKGARTSPCRTPVVTSNGSDRPPSPI